MKAFTVLALALCVAPAALAQPVGSGLAPGSVAGAGSGMAPGAGGIAPVSPSLPVGPSPIAPIQNSRAFPYSGAQDMNTTAGGVPFSTPSGLPPIRFDRNGRPSGATPRP